MQKIDRLVIVALCFVSVTIAAIWFREGKLIASGEEGIPYYSPRNILEVYKSPWYETGTGFPMPVVIPRITHIYMIVCLNTILTDWQSEMVVFMFLLSSGLIGMYLLSKNLGFNLKASIFASLFYLFNTFALFQVWGRMLYVGYFAWSYLPLFTLITIKLLQKPSFKYCIFLFITNIVFSNTYGQPAFSLTFWSVVMMIFTTSLYKSKGDWKNLVNLFRNFIIFTIIWIMSSLWWLVPVLKINTESFSELVDWKTNYNILTAVTKYYSNIDVILLRQKGFTNLDTQFGPFYSSFVVVVSHLIIAGLVIIGLVRSKRNKNYLLIVLMLIAGWFVSKGSNPPLGEAFFVNLFKDLSFAQTLRNPYEKYGMVFLLPYSILFGAGLASIKNKLVLVLICIIALIPSYPLYGGKLLTEVQFVVPDSYKDLDEYINQENSDSRLLIYPPSYGDGAKFSWGYGGLEPSEFIYKREAVSKLLRTAYFDEKYKSLVDSIETEDEEVFLNVIREMDIGYIVIDSSQIMESDRLSKSINFLERIDQIRKIKDFEHISLYKYVYDPPFDRIVQLINGEERILQYKEVSKNTYNVIIPSTDRDSIVVLKNTYNSHWNMSDGVKKLYTNEMYYDYANSWKIEPHSTKSITIVFD